jgi:membrane protein
VRHGLNWKELGRQLMREIRDDQLSNGAAALAFYTVLAIFPAITFALALLPYLPIPRLDRAIMDLVREALPPSAADLLTKTVTNVVSRRSGGLLSFGLLFTVWSASNGLSALMQQLNVVFNVEENRSFVRTHVVALLLTVLFSVIVVGTLGLVVFGGVVQSWIGDALGWSDALRTFFAVFRWVVLVGALHGSLTLVYHLAPNTRRPYRWRTPGSIFAALGILIASIGFKLYVASFGSYDALYGGIGAVIVLLTWLLVIGWVILLGAEIDDVLERHGGLRPAGAAAWAARGRARPPSVARGATGLRRS